MRGLIRCCLFLCFPVLLWAQDGVQVKRERVFTGFRALWFHEWRGRADFLEYGVSRLTARDVVYKGEDYTLEIYEMPSPEDAFGIHNFCRFSNEVLISTKGEFFRRVSITDFRVLFVRVIYCR